MSGVVRLRSEAIAAEVHPRLGGRVTSLVELRTGREALWSSPNVSHRPHPAGTAFDDVFAGGWDELVPNDEPTTRDGRALPDHGELWSAALDVASRDGTHLTLVGALPISGLTIEKRISAEDDELAVSLRIGNPTADPLGVQLKLHPALKIATGARVLAPVGRAHVPDPALSRAAGDFDWPQAVGRDGTPVRADVVPAEGPASEWLVIADAGRRGVGRCALMHEGEDWAVTFAVDPDVLPALWVFADYGGWQGLRFLVLEPASDAATESSAGTRNVLRLHARQTLQTTVRCRVGRAGIADGIGEASA